MIRLENPGKEEAARSEEGLPPSLISLRLKLGRKAKQEPKFRFYSLYGHISRNDTLEAANPGTCASLRQESSQKPDAGNPPVRFGEGEGRLPLPTLMF